MISNLLGKDDCWPYWRNYFAGRPKRHPCIGPLGRYGGVVLSGRAMRKQQLLNAAHAMHYDECRRTEQYHPPPSERWDRSQNQRQFRSFGEPPIPSTISAPAQPGHWQDGYTNTEEFVKVLNIIAVLGVYKVISLPSW